MSSLPCGCGQTQKTLRVTQVTFRPVTSNGVPVNFPARIALSFNRDSEGEPIDTVEYSYDPRNPKEVTFITAIDVLLSKHGGSDVKGRLWALDRQTKDCYYTLVPFYPITKGGHLYVNVYLQGPATVFALSVKES